MLGRFNQGKEEKESRSVTAEKFAEDLTLKTLFAPKGHTLSFTTSAVCRPGLYLAGHDAYFAASRVILFGSAEMSFAMSLDEATLSHRMDSMFALGVPCAVIARGIKCPDIMLAAAKKHNVPLYSSKEITGHVGAEISEYINSLLAEETTIHGVLVDVSGMGVLLVGKSGIGKSEVALELVHRGHRLVADDSVVIRKKNGILIGAAPDIIRHMLEIRGVGIINVERMFGSVAVRVNKSVDAVIELVDWEDGKTYERLGTEDTFETILGVRLPKLEIPVKAGRNLFVVIEAAVASLRLKEMGYSAPKELEERLTKREE